jgi:hypothetical protein
MKKLLVTLDIDYTKKITDITYPYMKSYADKIGADFKIIKERKFPNQPVNIEKFQLYQLSEDYDWTIFIDADALINPNCPDMTEIYEKDVVIFNGYDLYPTRFKANNYTRRDKRNISACTWFSVFSDWTRHLWKPYKNSKEYVDQIDLLWLEKNFGYSAEHILDDYLVSRNIAKYGLKVKTIQNDFLNDCQNITFSPFLIHYFCVSLDQKIELLTNAHNKIKNDRYENYINLSTKSNIGNYK